MKSKFYFCVKFEVRLNDYEHVTHVLCWIVTTLSDERLACTFKVEE